MPRFGRDQAQAGEHRLPGEGVRHGGETVAGILYTTSLDISPLGPAGAEKVADA